MSRAMTRLPQLLIAAAMVVVPSVSVRADAIDGDWCNSTGKRMAIRGPDILTPGGTKLKGNYTRHFFSYVIPQGESGAGKTMAITLLSEYLAHAREGGDDAPVIEWRRCQPGIS